MKREENFLVLKGGSAPRTPQQGYDTPAPPFRNYFAQQSSCGDEGLRGQSPLPDGVWEFTDVNGFDPDAATPARRSFKTTPHSVAARNPHAFPLPCIPIHESLGKEGMGAWGKGRNSFSKGFLPFPHISTRPTASPHNAGDRP